MLVTIQILGPLAELTIDFLLVEATESGMIPTASLFLFERHTAAFLSFGTLFFYVLDFFLFFDF